jgi:hypothetical protein
MYRRPFLVLPGGVCVPLEGDWRVEEHRGEWYVLGNNAVHRFESEREAVARFAQLAGIREPDLLAELAVEAEAGELFGTPGTLIGEADLLR